MSAWIFFSFFKAFIVLIFLKFFGIKKFPKIKSIFQRIFKDKNNRNYFYFSFLVPSFFFIFFQTQISLFFDFLYPIINKKIYIYIKKIRHSSKVHLPYGPVKRLIFFNSKIAQKFGSLPIKCLARYEALTQPTDN